MAIDFLLKKLKISDFSSAIPDFFLKFPAWAEPIFVIIAISGFEISESFYFTRVHPNSSIHNSVFFGILANVRGIPISLLRLPKVL